MKLYYETEKPDKVIFKVPNFFSVEKKKYMGKDGLW